MVLQIISEETNEQRLERLGKVEYVLVEDINKFHRATGLTDQETFDKGIAFAVLQLKTYAKKTITKDSILCIIEKFNLLEDEPEDLAEIILEVIKNDGRS